MYFEDVIIHGVHTTIGDAEITVYRVEGINRNPVIPIDSPETPLLIHDHFYYELHLMTAEQTGFVIGDGRIPLECGSLLVIPPHTAHYPFPENESAQELVFAVTMNITDGEAGFFSYFLSSLQEIACRAYPLSEPLFQQMCAFHAGFDTTGLRAICEQKMRAHAVLLALFDQINGFNAVLPPPEKHARDEEKRVILEFLINDAQCPISVIAERLGYSVRHTARMIRSLYGRSLAELRCASCLSTAKQLLLQVPRLSMEEIARMAGFRDAEAMRRAFQREKGITPTAYRKRMS